MRADRLLSLLLLLQVNRRITARELAERLEVSERTILRDMEALSGAGIPVTAERGKGGGWGLLQAYRTDLTGLNTAEIQTLVFAHSSRLIADLGLGRAADAALIKLLAALPALSRREVERTRERLHVDGAGWYRSGEAFPLLPLLQEATWQERKVDMTYARADGTMVERRVDPLGLVAKGSIWYLIAAVEGEIRNYRISRVQAVTVTEIACERPAEFDLAAFWERTVADFKTSVPRYTATVRVTADLLSRLRRGSYPQIVAEIESSSDGWTTLTVLFETESEACDFVIRSSPEIIAQEPAALRGCIRARAEAITALYPPPASGV